MSNRFESASADATRHKGVGMRRILTFGVLLVALCASTLAQDWIRTGTGLGVEKVRLAATDFKPSTQDAKNAELLKTFSSTVCN